MTQLSKEDAEAASDLAAVIDTVIQEHRDDIATAALVGVVAMMFAAFFPSPDDDHRISNIVFGAVKDARSILKFPSNKSESESTDD